MWDLPRPGLKPVSPALAGRLLTTVPPRKSRDIVIIKVTYQLSYVFLDGVWINKHSDCNQGVQGKIKDLVTEEWDDPGRVLLNIRQDRMLTFNMFTITKHYVFKFREIFS